MASWAGRQDSPQGGGGTLAREEGSSQDRGWGAELAETDPRGGANPLPTSATPLSWRMEPQEPEVLSEGGFPGPGCRKKEAHCAAPSCSYFTCRRKVLIPGDCSQ